MDEPVFQRWMRVLNGASYAAHLSCRDRKSSAGEPNDTLTRHADQILTALTAILSNLVEEHLSTEIIALPLLIGLQPWSILLGRKLNVPQLVQKGCRRR